MSPKIIVLTPVKNEVWILDRFLSVTSQFADLIIILDQNSTDGCLDVYNKYKKVHLYNNESEDYNEAQRQLFLINKARELVKGPKILLALDADEILAADAMGTIGWQTMLNAKPGTTLCFEKPELLHTPERTIRYDNTWPIGYVDDGADHIPSLIHSIRVPYSKQGTSLHLHDIKILHYAMLRMSSQNAKRRMYSVIENIKNVKNIRQRRKMYSVNYVWDPNLRKEKSPPEWFEKWEKMGIDMRNILDQPHYWQDYFVLQMFAEYGTKKFWFDDIWVKDWEKALKYFRTLELPNLPNKIIYPSKILKVILKLVDIVLWKIYYFKNK